MAKLHWLFNNSFAVRCSLWSTTDIVIHISLQKLKTPFVPDNTTALKAFVKEGSESD